MPTSSSSAPPAKRTCNREEADPVPDWSFVVSDVAALKCIADGVASIMSKVILYIRLIDGERYLVVDGNGSGYTCWIKAQIVVEDMKFAGGEDKGEEVVVCVECSMLQMAIDNGTCGNCSILFESHVQRESKVHAVLVDPADEGVEMRTRMRVFVDDCEDPQDLDKINFEMKFGMNVARVRDMLRRAKKARAEHLHVEVRLDDGLASGTTIGRSSIVYSFTGDKGDGQCSEVHTFTEQEGGMLHFGNARQECDASSGFFRRAAARAVKFSSAFHCDRIESFLKIVSTSTVEARIVQGFPLFFKHVLDDGEGRSLIEFLVAPVFDEEEM